MSNFCLALCRFCLSAWLGAAALFVTAGVAEIKSNKFDAATINELVVARFPHYYNFGFTLVGIACVTSFLCLKNPGWSKRRSVITGATSLLALMIMLVDYYQIFLPLMEMMKADTLNADFEPYHNASKNINMLSLSILLVSAWVACWPGPKNRLVDPGES